MEIYTKLSRFFPGQFRKPSGLLGHVIGWLESRQNEAANEFTLEYLAPSSNDNVLELGYGPGRSIRKLQQRAYPGLTAGIDYSPLMAGQARRKNYAAIIRGEVLLTQGDLCRLPFVDNQFDKILMVSVIYFLVEPKNCLKEVFRVQKSGGRLGIYMTSKEDLVKESFTQIGKFHLYSEAELGELLTGVGYRSPHIFRREIRRRTGLCIIADKPD